MINEKKIFKEFLSKILEKFKKYQNEIEKTNNQDIIKFKNEFQEGIDYFENCLKENKELTNENKEKIFQLIILTLSAQIENNITEISLEAIEIIALNEYFPEEIINNNINNLTEQLIFVYNKYNNNLNIIIQIISLIKAINDSKNFNIKNQSLYNLIMILIINNTNYNIVEDKITTYQSRKMAKLVLNKLLEKLISKTDKNSYDGFENMHDCKYYTKYNLNGKLYYNYINQLMKYYLDSILANVIKNDNKKNEKGIDRGKFNWCFNCRNEANYFSEDLSLPICSKKCECIIKHTEKLLNMKIYYNPYKYSIFEDYINTIKIISFNALSYLKLYLFNYAININFQSKLNTLDDKLNYFIEIIYGLLSQPIINDNKNNKYILDLIKEYIFQFLFENSLFNKRANNLK